MKKLFVLMLMIASCDCETIYYNNDFTSGALTMATQNLITTAYPPTWTVTSAPPGQGFTPDDDNVLKSGHGLLYYSNLGGTLNDRDTVLQLYWEFATDVRTLDDSYTIESGYEYLTGATTITTNAMTHSLEIGDIVFFELTNYTYSQITNVSSNTLTIEPGLPKNVTGDDLIYVYSTTNDVGGAIFDNVTTDAERGLVLGISQGTIEEGVQYNNVSLFVYDSGVYYPSKYKEGSNYRINGTFDYGGETFDGKIMHMSLQLTSNRYLKLYTNGQLCTYTADGLSVGVTTVDIQNIYYGSGNTQYVPNVNGFYVGVSSGAINRYQATGHYSYLDNLRIKQ
jgi:hypothetical protein